MKQRAKRRRSFMLTHKLQDKWIAGMRAWSDMAPIGREFGSNNYERLTYIDEYEDATFSMEFERWLQNRKLDRPSEFKRSK